jgi:putative Holliday junction resolvase
MALDVGSKRIGVAISDFLKLTAEPLLTLRRQNLDSDVFEVLRLAKKNRVERIIIGLPLTLAGGRSTILELVETFTSALQQSTNIRIEWGDERLSTKEAEELMSTHRIQPNARRKRRDEYAAALILTWYLEEHRHGG